MDVAAIAAIVFAAVISVVIAFQVALALGAPWGSCAMGGRYPGAYPPLMRVAALVQAGILLAAGLAVLSRAGLILEQWAGVAAWLVWVIAALLGVGLVLNLITPSAGERRIWAPVTLVLFVSCVVVALTA